MFPVDWLPNHALQLFLNFYNARICITQPAAAFANLFRNLEKLGHILYRSISCSEQGWSTSAIGSTTVTQMVPSAKDLAHFVLLWEGRSSNIWICAGCKRGFIQELSYLSLCAHIHTHHETEIASRWADYLKRPREKWTDFLVYAARWLLSYGSSMSDLQCSSSPLSSIRCSVSTSSGQSVV